MRAALFIVSILAFGALAYLFLHTPAALSEAEEKLYQSCFTSQAPQDLRSEPMCRCQAKKWGEGEWESAEGPSHPIEIKKQYVDELIKDWAYDPAVLIHSADQEKLALIMGISFECMKETGVIKPGAFDNLKEESVPQP